MEIATVYYEQLYYMGNLSKNLEFLVLKTMHLGAQLTLPQSSPELIVR